MTPTGPSASRQRRPSPPSPAGSDEFKAALGVLAAAVKEARPDVRVQAARALGQLGRRARAEAPALEECLKDPDAAVRYQAALALSQIGPAGLKAAARS